MNRRRSTCRAARTIAPAEQPTRAAPRSLAARAAERLEKVRRFAAREVDQVGLTDRLGVGDIVGFGPVPGEDGFDLRAEPREMLDTERRPALERLFPIRIGSRRHDRHTRAAGPAAIEQSAVEHVHLGEELAGANQTNRTAHRRQSSERGRMPARRLVPGVSALCMKLAPATMRQ